MSLETVAESARMTDLDFGESQFDLLHEDLFMPLLFIRQFLHNVHHSKFAYHERFTFRPLAARMRSNRIVVVVPAP